MSKTRNSILLAAAGIAILIIVILIICIPPALHQRAAAEPLPIWNQSSQKDVSHIVVISDIHLGVNDSFAETVANKGHLIDFLNRLKVSGVDELVIAGDFLDEWYVPVSYPDHSDTNAFFREVAANNKEVIAAFQSVIDSGIKVTYTPGNHDMVLDEKTLAEILPGIHQARDGDGIGVYHTGIRNEIVIEHGHRFDAFCSPNPLANKNITKDYPSYLPPGYFFTRIAATSVAENKSAPLPEMPVVPYPAAGGQDQIDAYMYYYDWAKSLEHFPVSAGFEEKIIPVHIQGYNDSYSLSDLLPTVQEDGRISARLYPDIQRDWDAIQEINNVTVKNSFATAAIMAIVSANCDNQSVIQYFNVDDGIDVVVFGHTHTPVLKRYTEGYSREKIYANSGSWIDEDASGVVSTFVAIESGAETTNVSLLEYAKDGTLKTPVIPKADTTWIE